MTSAKLPAAGKDGTRSYASQKTLDEKGTSLFKMWFEKVFKTECRTTNKVVQLRGVDLAVKLRNRRASDGPVGTDLKIDSYYSHNISFELVSQCRGHSKRSTPAVGWTSKDMPWVTYYFLRTGEVVFLDMAQVHPWLQGLVQRALDGYAPGLPAFDYWVAGTPNSTYQSFNLIGNIGDVLTHCPGAYYLRLTDTLSQEEIQQHIEGDLRPVMVKSPPEDRWVTPDQLHELMNASGCYHLKPQLSDDDMERLIRWCEGFAQYSKKEGVEAAGRALTASRIHRLLPEDAVIAEAA